MSWTDAVKTFSQLSTHSRTDFLSETTSFQGGARGVMVIFVGNGHSDTSSNPGRG